MHNFPYDASFQICLMRKMTQSVCTVCRLGMLKEAEDEINRKLKVQFTAKRCSRFLQFTLCL